MSPFESGRVATVSGYPHRVAICQFRCGRARACVMFFVITQPVLTQDVIISPDVDIASSSTRDQTVKS